MSGRTFAAIADELEQHMAKEEQIALPRLRRARAGRRAGFPFGSVENPIGVMLHEHDEVAAGLAGCARSRNGYEARATRATPTARCSTGSQTLEARHAPARARGEQHPLPAGNRTGGRSTMSTRGDTDPGCRAAAATRNLVLGTAAFAVSFSAWGLIAPLAKKFQDNLDLSNTRTLMLTAVPVVLGSLLRIPFGVITDRKGGRRVFTAVLLASAVPALAFGFVDSYWGLIVVGFFLGIAGASFAVGVPFVAGWYPKERQGFALGVYGMGNIGTAVAAFTAPAVVNHWGRPTLGVAAAL